MLTPLAMAATLACGRPDPVPADLDSAAAVARGRALFLTNCAICHGERADGQGARRASMEPPPRDFTAPGWRDRLGPHDLFVAIHDGRRGTPMPAWAPLGEPAMWDLVSYLRSVPPEAP